MKYLDTYKIYETLNSRGSKSITEEEFKEILRKNCKVWIEGVDNKLYRSQRNMGEYVYTDARGTVRRSIERINVHIDIMSYLDSWKDYPKYTEAIIGITDDPTVRYGSDSDTSVLYEMIPFDNMKIAVCPQSTIWGSFSKSGRFGEYIYALNYFLEGIDGSPIKYDTIENLKNSLMTIDNFIKYTEDNNFKMHYTIKDFLVTVGRIMSKDVDDLSGADIYNAIEKEMFDPTARGFELHTYDKDFRVKPDKQFWCNGPVLLVDKRLVDKIRENL